MKKEFKDILFTLTLAFALSLVFSSCSDDDLAASPKVTDPLDELLDRYAVTGTMANVAEFEEGIGDNDVLASKSQLYYDRVNKKMKFTWVKADDHIGIFAKGNKTIQMDFKLDPEQDLSYQEKSVTGVFMPKDGGVNPISGGTLYYTYFPYKEQNMVNGNFTYENIPISYRGQTQATNEQMNRYWIGGSENNEKFLQSEKDAAAHLSNYTYLISDASATAGNHVHFHYSYVGSIVRFYLLCPTHASDDIYYDSLQVYNSEANFTLDATVNIATKEVTPTKTSHVISLGFYPAIDMTNNRDDTKDTYHYWDKDSPEDGYIMAYMMISPINLKSSVSESSTLYLMGRKPSYYTYDEYIEAKHNGKSVEEFNALDKVERMKIYETKDAYNSAVNPDVDDAKWATMTNIDKMKDYERKFFKATLSKIDFIAGKHHQWSKAGLTADAPITFEEISIQEWEEGPGFNNEEGNGTGEW